MQVEKACERYIVYCTQSDYRIYNWLDGICKSFVYHIYSSSYFKYNTSHDLVVAGGIEVVGDAKFSTFGNAAFVIAIIRRDIARNSTGGNANFRSV